jgi:UDP-N-acetylmuramyl pentapeptide phosphotransferase/UDP-N-acetylglucosamine-1-phosphate transferase
MLTAFIYAFLSSLLTAVLIVVTQRAHGRLTLDDHAGVQKLHTAPAPRVGGVALYLGAGIGGFTLPADIQWFWWLVCLSALPAFSFGLLEDVTKQVGIKTRLLATICAGLFFCLLTGYQITKVGIPGLDWLFSFWLPSLLFTAFAIGGIANAINIIDGVNGLASGTSVIILFGFAIVAWQVGDIEVAGACLVSIGALIGFFLLNFPMGRLFLGDGGAYYIGFVLAVIAVALPQRNPELSPLIGLLALSYPVIETVVSISRRIIRKGSTPGQPDRLHLHSLIYRSMARRLAKRLRIPAFRNGLTGLMLLGLPILSSGLMVLFKNNSVWIIGSFALVMITYVICYRKVALMRPLMRGTLTTYKSKRENC